MWEKTVDPKQVVELRSRTLDYFGSGAIHKIDDICGELKKKGISSLIVCSSKSAYLKTGAWDVVEPALKKHGLAYVLYNKVTPNPTDGQVDEAVAMGIKAGAHAVIGIGGGSPIDVSKSVAILLENRGKSCEDLYTFEFTPEVAAPIVAINTTHGTGTELNRFAVVTVTSKDFKPAIAYDCIYPMFSIDDPDLMTKLPKMQTLYTSIDAVNHVVEAATSLVASPYTIMMAKETIRLVDMYLQRAMDNPDDIEARYYLLYSSAIGGIAFDNGLLHITHALEHPLSALKPELTHGLGLAIILPSVVKAIYPAKAAVLADLFANIVPGLKGVPEEADMIAEGIEQWLAGFGITQKLCDEGFTEKDVDRLTELAFETPSLDTLLSVAPIDATRDVVKNIYKESLVRVAEKVQA